MPAGQTDKMTQIVLLRLFKLSHLLSLDAVTHLTHHFTLNMASTSTLLWTSIRPLIRTSVFTHSRNDGHVVVSDCTFFFI